MRPHQHSENKVLPGKGPRGLVRAWVHQAWDPYAPVFFHQQGAGREVRRCRGALCGVPSLSRARSRAGGPRVSSCLLRANLARAALSLEPRGPFQVTLFEEHLPQGGPREHWGWSLLPWCPGTPRRGSTSLGAWEARNVVVITSAGPARVSLVLPRAVSPASGSLPGPAPWVTPELGRRVRQPLCKG